MSRITASLTIENVLVIQPVQWLHFTPGRSSSKHTTRSWDRQLSIWSATRSSKAAACYLTVSVRSLKLLYQQETACRTRVSARMGSPRVPRWSSTRPTCRTKCPSTLLTVERAAWPRVGCLRTSWMVTCSLNWLPPKRLGRYAHVRFRWMASLAQFVYF